MTELKIKDNGEEQKFPEIHYEKYLRIVKNAIGLCPAKLVEDVIREMYIINGYEQSKADDLPYQQAALIIFNKTLESVGLKPLSLAELYSGRVDVLNEYRSILNILHHTHKLSKHKMVFRFEEALTAKLTHTDLSKIDSYFLTSPFDSVYLDLPFNSELCIPNHHTGVHNVVGIYVSYASDVDVRNMHLPESSEVDEDGINPALKFNGEAATKVLRIMAIGNNKADSDSYMDDATFYMTFFFAPGDIFQQMEIMINKFTSNGSKDQLVYMRKLFSFVVNSLLYITNPSADLKKVGAKYRKDIRSKAKAAKKNHGVSKLDVVSVGSSIKISREFREHYRSGSLRNLIINVPKWMVRGHWRNQPHGQGNKLRRLVWIEPFEKGKGVDVEAVGREYSVE